MGSPAVLLASLIVTALPLGRAMICENHKDAATCSSNNDGGCRCEWKIEGSKSTCVKGRSCSGVGTTDNLSDVRASCSNSLSQLYLQCYLAYSGSTNRSAFCDIPECKGYYDHLTGMECKGLTQAQGVSDQRNFSAIADSVWKPSCDRCTLMYYKVAMPSAMLNCSIDMCTNLECQRIVRELQHGECSMQNMVNSNMSFSQVAQYFTMQCDPCMLAMREMPSQCDVPDYCDTSSKCNSTWRQMFTHCTDDHKFMSVNVTDPDTGETRLDRVSPLYYKDRIEGMCTPCATAMMELTMQPNEMCTGKEDDGPDMTLVCDPYCGYYFHKVTSTCFETPDMFINPDDPDKDEDAQRQDFMQKMMMVRQEMGRGCAHIDDEYQIPEEYMPKQPKCGKLDMGDKQRMMSAGWKPVSCSGKTDGA